MPSIEFVNECKVKPSFVSSKLASAFDLNPGDGQKTVIKGELPELEDEWQVGLIVGPSGSGKTSIARHVYGDCIVDGFKWTKDKAFVDDLGDDTKAISATLNSIGLNTVPAWLRPFHVLSNGEQFRATLARALMLEQPLVVFDEFTSVVDRTVAQIGCAALRKALRKKKEKRFIGVTCHFDIVDWLEPDWVLDMSSGELSRRRLRRPEIKLDIYRCHRSLWPTFKDHHYLNTGNHPGGRYFVGCIDKRPVAWCGISPHLSGAWRISRVVTLPEFQGVGIGTRLMNAVAERYQLDGKRVVITTSHPAMVGYFRKSDRWRTTSFHPHGTKPPVMFVVENGYNRTNTSFGRSVASFRYVGSDNQDDA